MHCPEFHLQDGFISNLKCQILHRSSWGSGRVKLEVFRFGQKALLKDDLGQLYFLVLKWLLETAAQVTNTNHKTTPCVADVGLPGSWYNGRRTAEWGGCSGETGVKSQLGWVPVTTTSAGLIRTWSREVQSDFHKNLIEVKCFDEKWGLSRGYEPFSESSLWRTWTLFFYMHIFPSEEGVCLCFVVVVLCFFKKNPVP